jgi:undecaprenyl-diphosphatase
MKNNSRKTNGNTWLIPARPITFFLLLFAFLLFFSIVWSVFVYRGMLYDEKLLSFMSLHTTNSRTYFMRLITFLGNHEFLIPANLVLIIYFLIKKNKLLALTITLTALSSLGLMSLLKNIFRRHRPEQPLIDGITNFSFPSGHAFMSVAFYGLLIWLAAISISNKKLQLAIIIFLLLLILAIGFSRIYLRVHYTSDVIAGFCFGFIWLMICLWLINKTDFQNVSEKIRGIKN